jgi:hypothetical protein
VRRGATATLIFVLLLAPVPAAGAQQTGRCYPPPCAVEEQAPPTPATLSRLSDLTPVGGPSVESDARSAAPLVGAGLLAVIGSLSVVALRRRRHILRRAGGPLRAPVGPSVGAPGSHEPQPALR